MLLDVLAELRGRRVGSRDSVLDIGCGPGDASKAIWGGEEECPEQLVGIDRYPCEQGSFWGTQGRAFVQADIADWNPASSFDIVWSSYSLHQIAAQFKRKPVPEWEDRLWQRIAPLVKQGGYFACISPADGFFFPLLSDVAERTLSRMGVSPDIYREQHKKAYLPWPKLTTEPPAGCGLQRVASLRLYSWRGLDEKTAFRSWWSANQRSGLLEELGLGHEPQNRFEKAWSTAWRDYRDEKRNGAFLHPDDPFIDIQREGEDACAIGEIQSLLKVWQKTHSSNDQVLAQGHRRPSVLPWKLVFACQEEAISHSTTQSSESSSLIPDGAKLETQGINAQFATNEPVVHQLLKDKEAGLESSTIYAIRLHESDREGTEPEYHAYSNKDTKYNGDNDVRKRLIEWFAKPGHQLARLNPNTEHLRKSKAAYAWAVHVHSLQKHRKFQCARIFSVGGPQDTSTVVLTVRHNVAKDCYDYPDTHDRICACWNQLIRDGLQVVLPDPDGKHNLSSLLSGPHEESQKPSTVAYFNYFAWQACIRNEHLFLLCNVSISDAFQESRASLGVDFAFSQRFSREILELGDLQLVATCLRSALTSGIRRVERHEGQKDDLLAWTKVSGHERAKLYSGLVDDLMDPNFLFNQKGNRQHLIIEFCRVVLRANNLDTVSGKGEFSKLPLLGDGDDVESAYREVCSLAWKLFCLDPNRRPTSLSTDEAWQRAKERFNKKNLIKVDTTACTSSASFATQAREWMALIVLAMVKNALEHSKNPVDTPPHMVVRLDSEQNILTCSVVNTHSKPEKSRSFQKQLVDQERKKGTFYVIEQYGRALFSKLNGRPFSRRAFLQGEINDVEATISVSIPVSTKFISNTRRIP